MDRKFYGSVNNEAIKIDDLYGSYNNETVRITKLYGSVGGETKLIHQRFGHVDYRKVSSISWEKGTVPVRGALINSFDPNVFINKLGTDFPELLYYSTYNAPMYKIELPRGSSSLGKCNVILSFGSEATIVSSVTLATGISYPDLADFGITSTSGSSTRSDCLNLIATYS